MKNLSGITAILVLIIVGLACTDGMETEKANGIIAEANKFIITANENVEKASKKYDEYIKKVDSINGNDEVDSVREFGKGLFPLYDSMSENFKKASEKFDEAGKLKVNPKYKEYLETKAKEMKTRSDYAAELKKIPQALIDTKTKQDYEKEREKINENVKKMTTEAKELGDKADKIQKDNPDIIKQN